MSFADPLLISCWASVFAQSSYVTFKSQPMKEQRAPLQLLGNAIALPQFPQNKTAGGCMSDKVVIISTSLAGRQADTEKMTVNQLTLHFLGRHE